MMVNKGHFIIAISGTTGAGAVEVARQVATRLECNYLDKERLLAAAELIGDCHLNQERVDEAAHAAIISFGTRRAAGSPVASDEPLLSLSVDDLSHLSTQLAIIRTSATQGSLVIAGRAARWVLADEPNLLSVCLHAPLEFRAQRICTLHSISSDAVGEQLAICCDERRANFIRRVAGPILPEQDSCHLAVDTWRIGIRQTVEIVLAAAKELQGQGQNADRKSQCGCPCPVP